MHVVLLPLLLLLLLFIPACAVGDAPPAPEAVGRVGWSLVLRFFLHLARKERLLRKRKRTWAATGLKRWEVPPKATGAKRAAQPESNDVAAPAAKKQQIAAPIRRVVDPDARDPDKPFRSAWLEEPEFHSVLFQEKGYVHCEACIRGEKKSDLSKISQSTSHGSILSLSSIVKAKSIKPLQLSWKKTEMQQRRYNHHGVVS